MGEAKTYSEIPLVCVLLVQQLVLDWVRDDVLQHDIGNRKELLFRLCRVMFDVRCLQKQHSLAMFERQGEKNGIPILRDPESSAQSSALLPRLSQFIGPGARRSHQRIRRIYRSTLRISSSLYCLSERYAISLTEGEYIRLFKFGHDEEACEADELELRDEDGARTEESVD